MLYQFAKLIAVRAIKLFYRRVNIKNRRYLPENGPIIFTANHPNTMMDPLLIGFAAPRRLHFIAKSTLFKGGLGARFLNQLQLIPVYRRQDNPDEMDKNLDSFERCYQTLEAGKSILIFPEGISSAERSLNRIKTGAARIGLGAEARNDFSLNTVIVPVGINYSDLVRFRSDVYIRFGQPISLREYDQNYCDDPVETVHLVTQRIETALKKLTTTLNELDIGGIVEGLERIYKRELIMDLGLQIKDKNDDFSVTKGLIEAVEWFYEHQPERVENFKKLLSRYQHTLDRLNLKDEFLSPARRQVKLGRRIYAFMFLILGFPFYLLGLINNYLPYQIPRWYTNRFVTAPEWYAPVKLIAGALVFLLYYGLILTAVGLVFSNWIVTLIYAASLVPSGNFVLHYLRRAQGYRQHLLFISIFYKKRNLIYSAIDQRMTLIKYINEAKSEYLQWRKTRESNPDV